MHSMYGLRLVSLLRVWFIFTLQVEAPTKISLSKSQFGKHAKRKRVN